MVEYKTLYVANRDEWHSWLEKNCNKESVIWLIFCKKHSGKRSVPYSDAVEEALCFGWIDSIIKRFEDEKYIQKFTPRKEKSRLKIILIPWLLLIRDYISGGSWMRRGKKLGLK
jgi:uncharacterized protein YdeI (YjbR/CyaY-like superfamily)